MFRHLCNVYLSDVSCNPMVAVMISSASFPTKSVPLQREHATAAYRFETSSETTNPGKEIDESETATPVFLRPNYAAQIFNHNPARFRFAPAPADNDLEPETSSGRCFVHGQPCLP